MNISNRRSQVVGPLRVLPSAAATLVWSLAAVLLLAAASPPLQACDNGTAVPNPTSNPGLVEDCKVLLGLRDQLAGTASLNWNIRLVMTRWEGISISGSPSRVTKLELYENPLTGAIPAELGRLTQLQRLELFHHQLTGGIPVQLGQLTQLQYLDLSSNRLTGSIPVELAQLTRLENLLLASNQLTGTIPGELGQLPNLRQLWLDENQLTGGIPPELDQLSQLVWLNLSENRLTGEIPVGLGRLTQLQGLRLQTNQLTGGIPPELTQLTRLQVLRLEENRLAGEIPPQLGQLSQLRSLFLSHNRLAGEIPSELGHLTQLANLDLSNNQLAGEIPPELGLLTQLFWIILRDNQLTGAVPGELGRLTKMTGLFLSHNQLTGEIPSELGQLTRLQDLDLSHNQLSGEIPVELSQLTQLKRLNLSHNQLTGTIPADLGQLTNLRNLNLSVNQLTGLIPPELGQLTHLWDLHLQHNQLMGGIPVELGLLSQLQAFSFRGNQLTGPVPTTLRHLPDVYVLNLVARWIPPGQMRVTWDDPGDPTVSYRYRLWETSSGSWTDWAEIPGTMLRAGEGVTIEWTWTGLLTDVAYTYIGIIASNNKGPSLEARALVRPLETPGDTPEFEPVTTLYFPHYADGEGWSVQLAISHIADAAAEDAEVTVTAYDREGQPIPGFFDPDGPFEIPPLGTRVFKSTGTGNLRMGWIEVQSDSASVSGLLTFRHAATELEVSVESVKLGRQFALFVEETSVIGTGLAIFKPDPSSRIEFRIRDEDGINPLGEGFATAGDFNQASFTVPEWFAMDGIDTEILRDFRGVLFLRAEDGSLFAPLGLRFGRRGESLSAVPVIPVTVVPE